MTTRTGGGPRTIPLTRALGLFLQQNSFETPDGASEVCDNVVISSDNVYRKRRGLFTYHVPSGLNTILKLFDYGGALFAIYGSSVVKLDESGNASATATGATFTASQSNKPYFATSNNNAYFTTDTGVFKIEDPATPVVYKAGLPRALDLTVTLGQSSSGANTGIHQPGNQLAYRIVFGRLDANNNLLLSAPSDIAVVANKMSLSSTASYSAGVVTVTATNTFTVSDIVRVKNAQGATAGTLPDGDYVVSTASGTSFAFAVTTAPTGLTKIDWGVYKTPSLEFTAPADVQTSAYFYRIYRSSASGGDTVTPAEDLALVFESPMSATSVVTVKDETDEIFKGATLYTNPNGGEGLSQSNAPPPRATDICLFKRQMFYANCVQQTKMFLNLISVVSSKFGVGDTVSVTAGGVTRSYTAVSGTAGTSQFQLTNSGAVSVGAAIDATARALAKAMNRDASGVVFASYISSVNAVPGQMLLVSRAYNQAFSVTATTAAATTPGACFSPVLPTSGTTVGSTPDTYPHCVFVSKADEPEAVPAENFIPIGSKQFPILRILALRDSLIIVKGDGVFRLNGTSVSNFTVTILDATVICKARDAAALLNNTVCLPSNQGIVQISESSVAVISRQIELVINAVLGKPTFDAQSFGVGYESERTYYLSTISPFSSVADTVYAYNAVNNTWTTIDVMFQDALVRQKDNTLYLVSQANTVKKERKNFNKLDYCDESFSATVTSVATDKLSAVIATVGGQPAVGDVFVSGGIINRVTEVTTAGLTTTTSFKIPVNFAAGASVALFKAIESTIKLAPLTAGDVLRSKEFTQFQVRTRNNALSALSIQFATDTFAISSKIAWTSDVSQVGWGNEPWGNFDWGEQEGLNLAFDTRLSPEVVSLVPPECARSTWIQAILVHDQAAEEMNIQAIGYTGRGEGTQISK